MAAKTMDSEATGATGLAEYNADNTAVTQPQHSQFIM